MGLAPLCHGISLATIPLDCVRPHFAHKSAHKEGMTLVAGHGAAPTRYRQLQNASFMAN
jgi:hypothetical protein